jgi:hypothetical protein
MKIFFFFVCLISISHGFLQYPFDMLDDYLRTIEYDDQKPISFHGMVPGEECNRECKPNDVKVCRFHFMMKYFQVMGG